MNCMKYLIRFDNLLDIRKKSYKTFTLINYLITYESIFALRYVLADSRREYEDYKRLATREAIFYRNMGVNV